MAASCQRLDKNVEPAAKLENTRWMLVQVEDIPVATSSYSESARSYLEFTPESKKTTGRAPCNAFSGTYTLGSTQGALTIGGQASTKATCPAQNLEDRYLNALPQTVRYEISGDELRLYGPDNSLRPKLVFSKTR
ncbi:META domain-containing protein [Hymenobacter sp. BT730]|uniref:META domain-containing protein n=1 Tax=Hymenobacter sp. BT730 TaxID=3063332 RepID=UPI0026DF66E8|nr:META domain-containing protein [Hymenobacter sp. BT730]